MPGWRIASRMDSVEMIFQARKCTAVSVRPKWAHGLLTVVMGGILAGLGGCQTRSDGPGMNGMSNGQPPLEETYRRAHALYEEGRLARDCGRSERARELLMQAVELDGTHGYARHVLGLLYAEAGDLYNAAIQFDAASRRLKDAPEPCYNLGVVLERGGRYEQAIAAYERALRRRPDHLYALQNLARARLRADYRDETTLRLLEQCRDRESRTEWVEWLDRQSIRLSTRKEARAARRAVSDGSTRSWDTQSDLNAPDRPFAPPIEGECTGRVSDSQEPGE
jgi:hypothetical protein